MRLPEEEGALGVIDGGRSSTTKFQEIQDKLCGISVNNRRQIGILYSGCGPVLTENNI